MSQDYYKTLGVNKDATPDDLKKAYRAAAKLCHPDKHPDNPEAEENFKKISEAYATLSDTDKRWAYDNNAGASHARGPAASGFGRGFNSGAFNAGGFDPFGDLFRDMFRRNGAAGPFDFGAAGQQTCNPAQPSLEDQIRLVGTVDPFTRKVSDQAKNAAAALSAKIEQGDTELAETCLRKISPYYLNRSPSLVKALLGAVPETCKKKFLAELIYRLNANCTTPESDDFVKGNLNLGSFLKADSSLAKTMLDGLYPSALLNLGGDVHLKLEASLPQQFYRSISLAYLADVGHNNLKERSDEAIQKLKEMAQKDRTLFFHYVEYASVETLEKVPEFKNFIFEPVNTEKNVSSIMQHVGKTREEPGYEGEPTDVAQRADRILGKLMHFDESVAVRCCEGIPADRIEASKLNDKLLKHAPEAYMKKMAPLYIRKLAEAEQSRFKVWDPERKAGKGIDIMTDWVRTRPEAGPIVKQALQEQFGQKVPKPIRQTYEYFFREVKNASLARTPLGRVAKRFGVAFTLH